MSLGAPGRSRMPEDGINDKQDEANLLPRRHGDACMDALSRVLASQAFAKSARLSSFLRYVCTASLEGRATVLREQHIGIEVFGRPEHFNPAEDTIVRTTARLLRQRLAQYYEVEGRSDEIRIAIPLGAYVPVFVSSTRAPAADAAIDRADIDEASPVNSPNEEVDASVPDSTRDPTFRSRLHASVLWLRKQNRLLGAATTLAAVVGLACVATWSSSFVSTSPHSSTAVFWATLFSADRDTLLVTADTGLVMYRLETGREVKLEDYIAKRLGADEESVGADNVTRFRQRRYTAMSSVMLAAELGKLATVAPQRFHVRFARDLLLGDLKRSNAIIVGVEQSNPWWGLFRNQLNFHIDWDRVSGKFLIRNDRPLAAEQASYEFSKDDPGKRGFASIAYTRSLGGDGHTLLIGGTTSAGTDAAIEFLLNPAYMEPLLKQARLPDGSVAGFEVLLQCVLQGDGNTDIQVLGLRTKRS